MIFYTFKKNGFKITPSAIPTLSCARNLYWISPHRAHFLHSVGSLSVGNVTENGKIRSELGFLLHIFCYLKNIQLLTLNIIVKLAMLSITMIEKQQNRSHRTWKFLPKKMLFLSCTILATGCIANISVMFLFPKYPLLKFLSHENTFLMSITEVN